MVNTNLNIAVPGGDSIQLLATKLALEARGVEVHVSTEFQPGAQRYDLIHVFNIQKGAVFQSVREMLKIQPTGTPIALSTIYWNPKAFNRGTPKSIPHEKHLTFRRRVRQRLEQVIRASIIPSSELEATHRRYIYDHLYLEYIKFGLAMASVILPNGHEELRNLAYDVQRPLDSFHAHVIPNAVSNEWLEVTPDPERFRRRVGFADFVLCVGKISPVKNQHRLLQAMQGMGIPIVFIGQNDGAYADYCRKLASDLKLQVSFVGPVQREELVHAYLAAKVHALPSWRETPGLASLEAGMMGCNLVVTPLGTTREYFGEDAWYCQPDDPESIRTAIMEAMQSKPRQSLKQRIIENFTWTEAARKTLEAYECMLASDFPKRHLEIPPSLFLRPQ